MSLLKLPLQPPLVKVLLRPKSLLPKPLLNERLPLNVPQSKPKRNNAKPLLHSLQSKRPQLQLNAREPLLPLVHRWNRGRDVVGVPGVPHAPARPLSRSPPRPRACTGVLHTLGHGHSCQWHV